MDTSKTDILITIYMAAAILGLVILYFVYIFLNQQRKIAAWQHTRIKAEIDTLENERKKMAGDFHDDIGPMLSAIKLQINHLDPEDAADKFLLDKTGTQIDDLIQRFRELCYNLLPNTLVRKGLVKALEEFVLRTKELHPLHIQLACEGDIKLNADAGLNLYRMLSEIIHNTIKHSKAANLSIHLQGTPSSLVVQTRDDGIGFNYQHMQQNNNGLGLLSMHSRATLLNGQLEINTAPGKGTSYTITIPLRNE